MILTNCAEGTLAPYIPSATSPWNEQRVAHLTRRLGFSASYADRTALLTETPTTLIDSMMDAALAAPLSPQPAWAYWNYTDYPDYDAVRDTQVAEWLVKWQEDFYANPLRGKMTLFWSNHFVTEIEAYDCPSHLYQYHKVLQEHSMGNLKDFIHAIGLTPAMLVYLNGLENDKSQPNENYGRELYELFALGVDNNYTQEDIEETARALTGYTLQEEYCGAINFDPSAHDEGQKTIFGQTGNWGYDDVIDILFEERSEEIANLICGKIYKFFVHPEINEDIVNGLSSILLVNNWDMEPMLRQLFKSEHFMDPEVMNTLVRSPFDHLLFLINDIGTELSFDNKVSVIEYTAYLGQYLSNPINVAGWQGNRSWISTSLLTARWSASNYIIYLTGINTPEKLSALAVDLAGSAMETNPELVTQLIIDYLIPGGLTDPNQYERATIAFKADIPQNYFDDGSWNLGWDTVSSQVTFLLIYIARMPEAQLF